METPTLYFFPLVVVLLLSMASSTMTQRDITTDQAALLSFKAHITLDPHHILQSNWSTSSSVCEWFGVTCGLRHHRVTVLDISSMNLTGTLPAQLGNLSFLASLDLSVNNFHGDLPEQLTNLCRLQVMVLDNNSFSGEIPAQLGSLSELRLLSLAYNGFFGSIPPSISNLTNLEMLGLSYNSLQGKIPSEIFSISTLESIDMTGNKLSGDLPIDMCHNLPRLEFLDLSSNALGGQIPPSVSNCSELQFFLLSSNNFSGVVPGEIGNLEKLEVLAFGKNNFTKGVIPQEIGNLRNLKELHMEETQRIGEISEDIGKLYKLERLCLQDNRLKGSIPMGIFNMSNLRELSLSNNQLVGTLSSSIGYGLPHLESLSLIGNNLGGVIPNSISNSTRLRWMELEDNEFIGEIPDYFGNLRHLECLRLGGNNLTSLGLKFITSLTKCQYLRTLSVSGNLLDGNIPISIGNFSALQTFHANDCQIRGSIPNEFGNLSKLIWLELQDNHLSGVVPPTMKALQRLDIANNSLQGSTLYTLCELPKLYFLNLDNNNISGPIPSCLDRVVPLQILSISNCGLTSIPPSFWNLKKLLQLNLSSNSLIGSLPVEIQNLKETTLIDLSRNQFTGSIPNVFANLSNLKSFFLSDNRLEGSIPDSIGKSVSLEDLDLSHNNLSGFIPKSLEALKYLKKFDISFNNLVGEIPSNGPFKNFTSESFEFNDALCGDSRFQVQPCPVSSTKRRKSLKKILIPFGIAMPVLAMVFIFLLMRCQRKDKDSNRLEPFSTTTSKGISYHELLEATNKYNESNLLGSGSFGSVYRGILKDGTCVAVKVFNLQLEGAFKSFEIECKVLCNLRHRNLTKVITSCCTEDFKALVLEFMPNGSLEKYLYSHNYVLNLMQRLNAVIDISCALEYLHHGYSTALVHCDLKPSNVLLDKDMVAHVSDFGITKLLGEGQSIIHTNTLATFGYIAPEYGFEGLVSTRCDVYSFGIMIMEVFTRKRPSDDMFAESLTLRSWVSNFTPHAIIQVVDANLIILQERHLSEKLKCLTSIMELALACSAESPNERMNMRDVVAKLNKIKLEFLADCGGS